MKFQVLSISFRLWGGRYFIFANSGCVWIEKEEWVQKKTLGTESKIICIGTRGGSRAAATSKLERFVIIVNGWKLKVVNYYHKALHLGCCSPRSASSYGLILLNSVSRNFNMLNICWCKITGQSAKHSQFKI